MKAILAAAAVFAASTGYGCTVCDSETGAAMRAGIFNGSFLTTFFEVLAPFLVLGLVLYAVNRFLPD